MPTIHVVSHTHWDREWYHTAGRFRQRLVSLVDELLDDPPADGASFLLDGQAVVLADYLAVRPERSAEVAALLRRGALEAGPWFVLGDELIPGGEALVRNLLAGRRVLRALRAEAPPVLYCPDSFGHPAALPALARGFGFDAVLVWRGIGSRRFPPANACWWRAPSGDRVVLYHLPRSGYEFGANLPSDPAAALMRWNEMRPDLLGRATLSVALVTNGADHHARQRDLPLALAALARAAAPDSVRASSLKVFAGELVREASTADLPVVVGELRDSYGYTWTLQGTLGARAYQKRRAAGLERLLVRDVEPWTALAARRTARSRRALVEAAWRDVLLCHPHDTLCGCSIDAVARAFDARADEAEAQAAGVREDALADLLGHDAGAARRVSDQWRPHVIVRNAAARRRGGVAIVSISRWLADVRVGPGSGPTDLAQFPKLSSPSLDGAETVQVFSRAIVHERTESPRDYPDDDLVERALAAVWVPPVDGYGLRALPITSRRSTPANIPHPVHVSGRRITNGRVEVDVDAAGAVRVTHHDLRRSVMRVLAVEDQDDAGDLYTASLRGQPRAGHCVGVKVLHRGPLRGAIETRWRVDVRRAERAIVTVVVSLDADSEVVRISVSSDNAADDHRLRLVIATGVSAPVVHADAAFGDVERVPVSLDADEAAAEAAPRTAPLHRYVTLSSPSTGATVYSDGLAEYEADADGAVHVTLLRAVGELSRNDLPERPGHAGWPSPTPEAQTRGPFRAELALLLHGPRDDDTIEQIERTADDVLVPLTGETIRSLVAVAFEMPGLTLEGRGLAFSAAKQSEDGEWMVLRCVNRLDHPVEGRWALAGGLREARTSRLDETVGEPIAVAGDAVPFVAGPRAIVTVLVR